LADGVLTAVAVHHQALDAEEQLLPLDQRKPGVAGHRFVLPCLWQELVLQRGWSAEQLWQALCFAPARLLGLASPSLSLGSDQWVVFDPSRQWQPSSDNWGPQAANQPAMTGTLTGQLLASGLIPELRRWPVSLA
jgi:dihydroorotase